MFHVTRVIRLVKEIDDTGKKLEALKSTLRELIRTGGERVVKVAVSTPKKDKRSNKSLAWRKNISKGLRKTYKQRTYRLTVPVVPKV
jgi:hypoxanthine phosphoribosyltransferase